MSALKCYVAGALLCGGFLIGAVNVTPNFKYTFEQCLVSKPSPSFTYCLGIGALNKLQSIDNDPMFDIVDGVTFTRDEQQPRTLYNYLERDPNDFSGIVDTMSHIASQRTLRWDMSTLYPGLVMRITPSVNGVLEFVMDPLHNNLELKSHNKEHGTGRLLARHFLLPLLLGFKFKVATLIPVIFGVLAIIAKKALIISKAALLISSSVALGNLLFGTTGFFTPSHHHGHHLNTVHGYTPQHDSWNTNYHGFKSHDSLGEYNDMLYKGFSKTDGLDQIKFSEPVQRESYERNINGRNFAWNDSEKETKS